MPMILGFQLARNDGILGACGEEQYVTNETASLCEAILDAVLWDELAEDVTFPTVICHSPEDEAVGIVNVPPVSSNHFVTFYEPNLSILEPRGSHFASEIICALDPVTVIAFGAMDTPVEMQAIGDLILSEDPSRSVPSNCKEKEETPTATPTSAPTIDNKALPQTNNGKPPTPAAPDAPADEEPADSAAASDRLGAAAISFFAIVAAIACQTVTIL